MIIRNFGTLTTSDARVTSAVVSWEDRAYPDQELVFEIHDSEFNASHLADESSPDAFLSACFPLAAVHGEARVRIEGQPCPMLIEGLYTAHAWWTRWGGMPTRAPKIETHVRERGRNSGSPSRAIGFLSGGVDSLHMLMRNRRLYRQDDLAYITDALFIHGFDIGKRLRDPENERFRTALLGLQHIAGEIGLRIIPCRTNLRHLPSMPDFWEHRHSGAAFAAVGHAAITGAAVLFVGSSYPVTDLVPWGSHPAVDGLFSSQRVTLVHDGSRFSRLQKVRDLASWPMALVALRVCPTGLGMRANCGQCEKCLRTRLELLAAGVEETEAFGPSLTPSELWKEAIPGPIGDRAIFYEDLIGPLRARGLDAICRILEEKIRAYRAQAGEGANFSGRSTSPHYN